MEVPAIRAAFAARVHELCDELGIPNGHGRQTALGKMFGVTSKAARKWLLGISYPEMPLAVAMCDRAGVNLLWFLQGTPPKRGDRVNPAVAQLADGLERLPFEHRQAVLDHMRYQFERANGWFTEEALARYMHSIDELQQQASNSAQRPLRTG